MTGFSVSFFLFTIFLLDEHPGCLFVSLFISIRCSHHVCFLSTRPSVVHIPFSTPIHPTTSPLFFLFYSPQPPQVYQVSFSRSSSSGIIFLGTSLSYSSHPPHPRTHFIHSPTTHRRHHPHFMPVMMRHDRRCIFLV